MLNFESRCRNSETCVSWLEIWFLDLHYKLYFWNRLEILCNGLRDASVGFLEILRKHEEIVSSCSIQILIWTSKWDLNCETRFWFSDQEIDSWNAIQVWHVNFIALSWLMFVQKYMSAVKSYLFIVTNSSSVVHVLQ